MNMSDSERVKRVLDGMGARFTENEEDANIIGILACSVRQKASDKVYNKIAVCVITSYSIHYTKLYECFLT